MLNAIVPFWSYPFESHKMGRSFFLSVQLLLLICLSSAASLKSGNQAELVKSKVHSGFWPTELSLSNFHPDFLQLSHDHSGENDDGTKNTSKMVLVFVVSAVICALCCGLIQLILSVSKSYRAKLSYLQKCYKTRENLLKSGVRQS